MSYGAAHPLTDTGARTLRREISTRPGRVQYLRQRETELAGC